MTKIYLVRHGATEWNHTRRAQGMADIDLNPEGRSQASAIAARLAAIPLVAVYSSDLKRAVDTARPIAATHSLRVDTDPRFREIDQGEWTGLSVDEIAERWPDLWGTARHYSKRPGGESPEQVRARALDGVEGVVREHPEGDVVIVSHGGTIRWLSAEALGYDDRRSATLRGVSNGGFVTVDARIDGHSLLLENLVRGDGATLGLEDDPNA